MASILDLSKLRELPVGDIYPYLKQISSHASTEAINEELLQAIQRGSVSPSLTTIWLGVSHSAAIVGSFIRQEFSISARSAAIRRLGTELKSSRWKQIWHGLGGTQGILDLMSKMSVIDVRQLCIALGSFSKGEDLQAKRKAVTDLLEALLPLTFPNSRYHREDNRPLERFYQLLVPGCTAEIVESIVEKRLAGDWHGVPKCGLVKYHAPTMMSGAIRTIFDDINPYKIWLSELFRRHTRASLNFKLDVLEKLRQCTTCIISDQDFMGNFATPLVQQMIHFNTGCLGQVSALSMILAWVEKRPSAGKKLSTCVIEPLLKQKHPACSTVEYRLAILDAYLKVDHQARKQSCDEFHDLCSTVIKLWANDETSFGTPLLGLLASGRHANNKNQELQGLERFLRCVKPAQRYRLLRLCNMGQNGIDIEILDQIKQSTGTVSANVFRLLEPSHALDLLARVRAARGDEGFLHVCRHDNAFDRMSIRPNVTAGDPELLRVLLLCRNGQLQAAEEIADSAIEDRKTKSATSSDQSQRAWHAKSAMYYAFASGSLRLVENIFEWTKRFIRDSLTIRKLYQSLPAEALIPFRRTSWELQGSIGASSLAKRIAHEHQALQVLLELPYLALREPAFQAAHWTSIFKLLYDIVLTRIKDAPKILNTGEVSGDELLQLEWWPTVQFLIHIEKEVIKPGHERLKRRDLGGVLHQPQMLNDSIIKAAPPSTYQFLDSLAKARDHLWQEHRPTIKPATLKLAEAYPRGLPVQDLITPFRIQHPNLETVAPYLASRVRTVVLPTLSTGSTQWPEKEDQQDAAFEFIDDYSYALRMYMPENMTQEEQIRRGAQAWSHAISILSASRMTKQEAEQYWRPVFLSARTEYEPYLPPGPTMSQVPRFPRANNPKVPQDWNPCPPRPDTPDVRVQESVLYIDLMKSANNVHVSRRTTRSVISSSALTISNLAPYEPRIWTWGRIDSAKKLPLVRECLIASALLYLDAKNASDSRLLANPFPSDKDVRYPSLYLSDNFSIRTDSSDMAMYALQQLNRHVPPVLLAHLVENTIKRLKAMDPSESNYADFEKTTFGLLKVLLRSDRPGLATEGVIELILQNPNASSWHRQILAPSALSRLSATEVRKCLERLAGEVVARMEFQDQRREQMSKTQIGTNENNNTTTSQAQKGVKISTVKQLAQILCNVSCVPPKFAIDALSILMHKATHPDIRRAAVESLLELLPSSPSDLTEHILKSLEAMLPLTGVLNERRPLTETDWAAAWDAPGRPEPPDVTFSNNKDMPIFDVLQDYIVRANSSVKNSPLCKEYVRRIVVPQVCKLQKETKKWLAVFLASVGGSSSLLEELPIVPGSHRLWEQLLTRVPNVMPVSILEALTDFKIFCANPPLTMVALNRNLRADPAVLSRPAVKEWMAMYSVDRNTLTQNPHPAQLARLFSVETVLSEGGITLKDVQSAYLKLFTAALWTDDMNYRMLSHFVDPIKPSTNHETWQQREKPVLEAMVAYIEGLRTREWERNPSRQPQVLPDTFPMRLYMLNYPTTDAKTQEDKADLEAQCRIYASQLTSMVSQIAGSLYHEKLIHIKDSFEFVTVPNARALTALYLGDLRTNRLSWASMTDVLRVELASDLLEGEVSFEELHDDVQVRLKGLVTSWRESDNEDIRRFSFGLTDLAGWENFLKPGQEAGGGNAIPEKKDQELDQAEQRRYETLVRTDIDGKVQAIEGGSLQ